MGTWDVGPFDNDDASDWVADLLESSDVSAIAQAFEAKEIEGYYLEAPEGACAVAASEVLAALIGRPSPGLPQGVKDWVVEHTTQDPERLVPKALQMLDRILAPHSELRELWEENKEDFPTWQGGILGLKARLGG